MLRTKSKQRIYYIIETEDKFLHSICNEIFEKTIIIEVKQVAEDKNSIRIKGSKDYQLYSIDVMALNQIAKLKQIINIHLN